MEKNQFFLPKYKNFSKSKYLEVKLIFLYTGEMTSNMISIIIAFVLYLSMMIVIGMRYMKKNETSSDFFLGGRQVGPWMTALSAEASDMSGWLLMGLPGWLI